MFAVPEPAQPPPGVGGAGRRARMQVSVNGFVTNVEEVPSLGLRRQCTEELLPAVAGGGGVAVQGPHLPAAPGRVLGQGDLTLAVAGYRQVVNSVNHPVTNSSHILPSPANSTPISPTPCLRPPPYPAAILSNQPPPNQPAATPLSPGHGHSGHPVGAEGGRGRSERGEDVTQCSDTRPAALNKHLYPSLPQPHPQPHPHSTSSGSEDEQQTSGGRRRRRKRRITSTPTRKSMRATAKRRKTEPVAIAGGTSMFSSLKRGVANIFGIGKGSKTTAIAAVETGGSGEASSDSEQESTPVVREEQEEDDYISARED